MRSPDYIYYYVTELAFLTDGVIISRHKSDVSGIMLFYTMKQTVVPKSSC